MHFRSDFQNAKTGLSSNILGGIPALASNILALARKVVHDSLGWLLDAKDAVVGRRRVEADDGPTAFLPNTPRSLRSTLSPSN